MYRFAFIGLKFRFKPPADDFNEILHQTKISRYAIYEDKWAVAVGELSSDLGSPPMQETSTLLTKKFFDEHCLGKSQSNCTFQSVVTIM